MSETRIKIIAEAGVNHNGSLDIALQLIEVAAEAGADAVKFQTFNASCLASAAANLVDYQKDNQVVATNQLEMLKSLEISHDSHLKLLECCRNNKIEFMSTPFDLESAAFLVRNLNLPQIKISSGEITNAPLLLQIANDGKPVILSTGMSDLAEIETALGVLAFGYTRIKEKPGPDQFGKAYLSTEGKKSLQDKVVLMHCTSLYPTPCEHINLRAMTTLRDKFRLPVGLSDHSRGTAVSVAAAALGAYVIEKHFTLDNSMPGPDHKASLEPLELIQLVKQVRCVESAMGSGTKIATERELSTRALTRKSLVAACRIERGERFTTENLTVKRPGNGISPNEYWNWLGRTAERDYKPDELL
jgi:N-acetylneuraminate synthase